MNEKRRVNTKIVYSDLHLFGPHAFPDGLFYQMLDDVRKYPHGTVVCLGDIFDFANCKHKHLKAALNLYLEMKFAVGKRYCIDGNHEVNKQETTYLREVNAIFEHGHRADWNEKKIHKWYRMKPGCSTFQWYALKAVAWARPFFSRAMSGKFADKAFKRLSEWGDATTYICGHKHYLTTQKMSRNIDGKWKTIISVPRGRTILVID